MPAETYTDPQGNTFCYKLYKGLKFHPDIPGNVEDQLRDVSSLKLRRDDVLLCTYPKSGTHWVYNMIEMIRSETLHYRGTPYMIEFHPSGEIEQLPSPRTIHTHLTYPLIPVMAQQGHVNIVHVLRNPKDAITSNYEHYKRVPGTIYQGDFSGFLDISLSDDYALYGGHWFSYAREWEKAKLLNTKLKILSLVYEDIKQDTYGTLTGLVEFLRLDRSESFLRQVEQEVQFENLKRQHETELGETDIWRSLGNGGRLPIYRKGCVGDWKNYFTVAQSERFDVLFDKEIKRHGIDISFSYQ